LVAGRYRSQTGDGVVARSWAGRTRSGHRAAERDGVGEGASRGDRHRAAHAVCRLGVGHRHGGRSRPQRRTGGRLDQRRWPGPFRGW
jgi:hypothetical protein